VGISFDMPEHTAGRGNVRCAVGVVGSRRGRFFAATSEIFGEPMEVPQSEMMPMAPINYLRRRLTR
jgi:GDP-D-mannose dehydratase